MLFLTISPSVVNSGRFPMCLDNGKGFSLIEFKFSVSVTDTCMLKVESFSLDNSSLTINYLVQRNYYEEGSSNNQVSYLCVSYFSVIHEYWKPSNFDKSVV